MYLADYHVHTVWSPDAVDSMTDLARAGIAAGMDELCFTDHLDSFIREKPFPWREYNWIPEPKPSVDWAGLVEQFNAAQNAVGDRIRLKLGVELGDAGWNFAHTEKLMEAAPPLDFVIGSQHMLSKRFGRADLFFFDAADEREALASIADYLEQMHDFVCWGKFSVLGHLTLPLRYFNEQQGFNLSFDDFGAEVEDIFRILIQNGKGIEVNTNRGNTPLPDAKWLKLYREMGGEIITLGTDAHSVKYVGCAIRERQQLLRECGFTRFCTFEQMQPVWHEL